MIGKPACLEREREVRWTLGDGPSPRRSCFPISVGRTDTTRCLTLHQARQGRQRRWVSKASIAGVTMVRGKLNLRSKAYVCILPPPVVSPAAAAAKSLQSCLTLCNPRDSSPPGSPIPGILQARTLEWVAISFSSAWKWKVKVKSLSRVWLLATPWTAAYQAPPSMGFSRQEYWSGLPLPSPVSPESSVFTSLNLNFLTCPEKYSAFSQFLGEPSKKVLCVMFPPKGT